MTIIHPIETIPSAFDKSFIADWFAMQIVSGDPNLLDALQSEGLSRLEHGWLPWARTDQETPEGDWTTWLVLGGRGAGKTRTGAEWIAQSVRDGARRIALVGETYEDAREVMIDGPSGLSNVGLPEERPSYEPSRHRLVWPNGAEAHVFSADDPDGLRGHQHDTAWADELGSSAVDKGANQPNVFLDPKSSESARPYHSDGNRDDLIQRRFLEAHLAFWSEEENNPVSPVYGGPMVSTDHIFLYTWDARPFPDFPVRKGVWSDAENWTYGHWLNGRAGRVPLSALIEDLARRAGLHAVDASACTALVTGYVIDRPMAARDALQPLFDLYQLDAVERDGVLVVTPRTGEACADVASGDVADTGEPLVTVHAAQGEEMPARLSLSYTDGLSDYRPGLAAAGVPGGGRTEGRIDTAVVLEQGEAEGRLATLLAEAAAQAETARFALPPDALAIEPSDVLALEGMRPLRLTRITDGPWREVEGVLTDPGLFAPRYTGLSGSTAAAPVVAGPVSAAVMDLPILPEGMDGLFLHAAAFAEPWPGAVLVLAGEGDAAPEAGRIEAPALMGRLTAPLAPGAASRWDRASVLSLHLPRGSVASLDPAAVLGGAGRIAVENTDGGWEILSYADADLQPDGTWRLTRLLRGLRGTEEEAAAGAPLGARIVFLGGAVSAPLPPDWLGREGDWQAGPAAATPGAFPYRELPVRLEGASARPFAPCHLHATAEGAQLRVSWVRRSRIGGDAWTADVPLGEAQERYRVSLWSGGEEMSAFESDRPNALVDPAGADELRVQQVSAVTGPGRAARLAL